VRSQARGVDPVADGHTQSSPEGRGIAPAHVRLRMTLAYDGSAYAGWQVQTTGEGVQERVELALARLFPKAPKLHSSSRTDTGVHALGMVAHCDVPRDRLRIPARKLVLALNAHLPQDIRVVAVARAPHRFHARFDAVAKEYRYQVWNHPAMNPLLRPWAWHVPRRLDWAAMRTAAQRFLGTHDFQSFAANPGYAKASTVRTLTHCQLSRRGPLITFRLQGDGFLYKMCRGIVGTLVQVGLGKFAPATIEGMLAERDRRVAGMSAPAHGLVLWKVFYPRRTAIRPSASAGHADRARRA